MIVKDEARALGRCLASVRDWVGEMIVVDTGSTDVTTEIARSYGAQVSHFPWCDDFSAARNAALDLATREWVLVLDGDETLEVTDTVALARALEQSRFDGFSIPISSLNDDGSESRTTVFRLFRRCSPGMRYRGEIHEQLEGVAAGRARTSSLSCVRIDHDGYIQSIFTAKEKEQRNTRLAQKLAKSRPEDPFSWFVMAMALLRTDTDQMLVSAQKAFDLLASTPHKGKKEQYLVNLYVAVIGVYRAREANDVALQWADRALEFFPSSPDLRCQRGDLKLLKGNFTQAIEDFTYALSGDAKGFMLILDPATTGHGARTGLAKALWKLNRRDEALSQLHRAIDESPAGSACAHAELGSIYLQLQKWDQAVTMLEEAYHRDCTSRGVATQLAWCLYQLKRFTQAQSVLNSHRGEPQADHLLARILLENGGAAEAVTLLLPSTLPASLPTLGWAYFLLDQPDMASTVWDRWLSTLAGNDPARRAMVAFRALLIGTVIENTESDIPAKAFSETDSWLRLLLRYGHRAHVERVISQAPMLGAAIWPDLRMRWAQVLAMAEHTDLSIELLIGSARDTPDDDSIYYWLGYCAAIREQLEDARVMFQECLRLNPNHLQARQALTLLP
jgi:tetratricopeptide (TPR) repeat protein